MEKVVGLHCGMVIFIMRKFVIIHLILYPAIKYFSFCYIKQDVILEPTLESLKPKKQ